jgi:hypothetical protein
VSPKPCGPNPVDSITNQSKNSATAKHRDYSNPSNLSLHLSRCQFSFVGGAGQKQPRRKAPYERAKYTKGITRTNRLPLMAAWIFSIKPGSRQGKGGRCADGCTKIPLPKAAIKLTILNILKIYSFVSFTKHS